MAVQWKYNQAISISQIYIFEFYSCYFKKIEIKCAFNLNNMLNICDQNIMILICNQYNNINSIFYIFSFY